MDIQDTGLTARAERRTRHEVSIPSGLVLELLQIAQELGERAAYIENYSDAHAAAVSTLRFCAGRVKAIAERANS